jgi:hypothetical protein
VDLSLWASPYPELNRPKKSGEGTANILVCLIAGRSYHFVIAIWSEKEAESGHTMKTNALFLLPISMLVSFAPLFTAQAVSPAPDGGYPGGNTAEGTSALLNLTTGTYNTAIGIYSLLSLTDGDFCTGVGAGTLLSNTADQNTATGAGALLSNTTGLLNTANGAFALFSNATGAGNTASGQAALAENTSGQNNTADGAEALNNNTVGNFNTALGTSAGSDVNGSGNVCIGAGVSGEAGVDDSTYIRNVNTTEQSPANDVAFVTVRLSDGRIGHQPLVMRSASSELQKTVDELQATVAQLTQQLKEQAAQIQKVAAQLEASKPAPQVVNNP